MSATLRCAACHRKCRVLLHGLGPTCAKQLGITLPRAPRTAKPRAKSTRVPVVDPDQLALELEVMA